MFTAVVPRWVWLFLPLTLSHASTNLFSVEVPKASVSGLYGGSVSLPCTVSKNIDVRQFEVRWYRPSMYITPVLLYKSGQIVETSANKQYLGRVSLLGALEKGDVSLKLDNLMMADEGLYICHVGSDSWYDKGNMSLKIRAVGSTPILSVADAGEGHVNVSCHSHGWLPKPSLNWRDGTGTDLKHVSKDMFTEDSEGLLSVSSWRLVSSSESGWLSCSVALSASNQEMRESRVVPHTQTVADSWKEAFIVVLLILLLFILGFGVYFMLNRKGLICSKKQKKEHAENLIQKCWVFFDTAFHFVSEIQPLNSSVEKEQHEAPTADAPHQSVLKGVDDHQVPEPKVDGAFTAETDSVNPPHVDKKHQEQNKLQTVLTDSQTALKEWDQMKRFKVNLTIDPEETPQFLMITNQGKSVCCPDLEEVDNDDKIFTLCKEKFSSGKHYWEVKVMERNEDKLSWYVGVASDEAERMYRVPLTPANGFWVLCYDKESEEDCGVYSVNLLMPQQLKTVTKKSSTLGVFLDCDEHTVSFYDADRKSLMYTFTNMKPGRSLYPLISPGIRDRFRITVC
ncbi:butyrophilin subfamily 2 member A2-like isoform X2 [Colossoma macropomum]|uniref:butyrophilin subfamily 2 member A2-like isoform X2 n=1 Tax=Colossoma macropomum TaxID=42526 RepID=UPI0018646AF3|nr:butyrophilin subfamily 2 member A2-like isoform X2 [Colossoma macropomum]